MPTTPDSSGNGWTGTIIEAGPGKVWSVNSPWSGFSTAFQFEGQDYSGGTGVKCGTVPMPTGVFTLEARVQVIDPQVSINGAICGWATVQDIQLWITNNVVWFYGTSGIAGMRDSTSNGALADGNPHVIAISFDGSTYRLFIDGVVSTSRSNTQGQVLSAGSIFWIGTDDYADDVRSTIIDEVRLSNVARYAANYTPASSPFTTDASTIALWHLDTGATAAPTPPQTSQFWLVSGGSDYTNNMPAGSHTIAYSNDNGYTWTNATIPSGLWNSQSFATDGTRWLCACWESSTPTTGFCPILISNDTGHTWSFASSGNFLSNSATSADSISQIAYANSLWVAVGQPASGGTHTIAHSSDGSTWTVASNNPFSGGRAIGVAYSSGTWVAAGVDSTGNINLAYSTNNAVTWTAVSGVFPAQGGYSNPSRAWVVAYNGSYFTAVATTSTGYLMSATSTDGQTWTTHAQSFSTGNVGGNLIWDGIRWTVLISGGGGIATSTDGATWTRGGGYDPISTTNSGVQAIAYASGTDTYIVVGGIWGSSPAKNYYTVELTAGSTTGISNQSYWVTSPLWSPDGNILSVAAGPAQVSGPTWSIGGLSWH